jgi:hypothetical protein
MGSLGLYHALKNNGLLNYAFNTTVNQKTQMYEQDIDTNRLNECPIYYVRGFLNGRMSLVARTDTQFKACWQSESYYTRRGDFDSSTQILLDNLKHFQMLFVSAESDLEKYDIPTYFLPSWADTSVLKETCEPEYEGLGFIGGHEGREDFLGGDTKHILSCKNTGLITKSEDRAKDYTDLICKFKYLVSPPGRCFNGMCGRAFEIMACNRLCFQYLNEDTMFEHMKFFKDGYDIVYFHDWEELNRKFEYYKNEPELCKQIAYRGFQNVMQNHNHDIRAKYIVKCMEIEYKKWNLDQEKIVDLDTILGDK